jgi:hypothetical protein
MRSTIGRGMSVRASEREATGGGRAAKEIDASLIAAFSALLRDCRAWMAKMLLAAGPARPNRRSRSRAAPTWTPSAVATKNSAPRTAPPSPARA